MRLVSFFFNGATRVCFEIVASPSEAFCCCQSGRVPDTVLLGHTAVFLNTWSALHQHFFYQKIVLRVKKGFILTSADLDGYIQPYERCLLAVGCAPVPCRKKIQFIQCWLWK